MEYNKVYHKQTELWLFLIRFLKNIQTVRQNIVGAFLRSAIREKIKSKNINTCKKKKVGLVHKLVLIRADYMSRAKVEIQFKKYSVSASLGRKKNHKNV